MRSTVLVPVIAVVIVLSGVGFYVAMSPGQSHGNSTSSSVSTQGPTGYQLANGTGEGTWSTYLGYIPVGYTPSPLTGAAPTYPCPTGMTATQCATFHQTCGNGVCDPNETCNTCPLDCPVSGAEVCDPFTGRAGSPASICQQIITGPGA